MCRPSLVVIGLGYVGLPLAIEFGKKRSVVGFDINQVRVDELKSGQDHTLEASPAELAQQLRNWKASRGLEQMCADAWRWQQGNVSTGLLFNDAVYR